MIHPGFVLWQARSHDLFYIWLTKLCAHRIFKKNEALSVHRGVRHALSGNQGTMPSNMTNMTNMAPRNAVSTSGPAGGLQQILFMFQLPYPQVIS